MARHKNNISPSVGGMVYGRPRRPEAALYRVARIPGATHDRGEADVIAKARFGDVEFIGSDARWYLYQEKA